MYSTVTTAATAGTSGAYGNPNVSVCTPLSARRLLPDVAEGAEVHGRRLATSASYSIVTVVPAAGGASAATAASTSIAALQASSFLSTIVALSVATGQPQSSFTFSSLTTVATCSGSSCVLPSPSAVPDASSSSNVGAIVGGVVGGLAAVALIVIAVVGYQRGWCASQPKGKGKGILSARSNRKMSARAASTKVFEQDNTFMRHDSVKLALAAASAASYGSPGPRSSSPVRNVV